MQAATAVLAARPSAAQALDFTLGDSSIDLQFRSSDSATGQEKLLGGIHEYGAELLPSGERDSGNAGV